MFDKIIDRRGSHSVKWDMLQKLYGVSPDDGIAMWVADMDFSPPQCVLDALGDLKDHGIFGYYGDYDPYHDAICNWMKTRHGWSVDPDHIFSTHGLVNGTALCLQAFSNPGDGVVLFTPVYHAFSRIIKASDRRVIECEMTQENGRYLLDFERYDTQMDGSARIAILCSPHNPGGRVWSRDELQEIAAFAKRHDLILISDEIHHDLVFPGRTHIPMPVAAPEISDRLVMMTAASKTFNLAGGHTGNVIIADDKLRAIFQRTMTALGISPNNFGIAMTEAAYRGGAAWVDALISYLDENRRIFDQGIAEIPGLSSMPLEATYLAWVDFSGTGMSRQEFTERVQNGAKIAANHGPSFGTGGENYLRFNFGAPRRVIEDAISRLKAAFHDLQ